MSAASIRTQFPFDKELEMFSMQEAYARERCNDFRREAVERGLAKQVASVALWARVAAVVADRRSRAESRLSDRGNTGPEPARAVA